MAISILLMGKHIFKFENKDCRDDCLPGIFLWERRHIRPLHGHQHFVDRLVNPGVVAGPRTGDIEDFRFDRIQPALCHGSGRLWIILVKIDVQERAIMTDGQRFGQRRTTGERPVRADQRGIGAENISFGPIAIPGRFVFQESILRRQWAVLGFSTSGEPATMGNFQGDGRIKRRQIRSGLTSGYNFHPNRRGVEELVVAKIN